VIEMRVLLAIDGSESSDAAYRLVASLRWPEATVVQVVAVVEPMSSLLAGLSPYAIEGADERVIERSLRDRLTEVSASLERAGLIVERYLAHGRPASVIVDEAEQGRAELIVVGSRGLGRLSMMLLGSVSAEVVDHAPCPVLVARRPRVGSVLLAVDGSATARRALELLEGASYLRDRHVEVISVGPPTHVRLLEEAAELPDRAGRGHKDELDEIRFRTEAHAAAAAEELAGEGIDVRWSIAIGDPAHEIIDAAASLGCDLIVMGSRGLTGLDRLRLGSVARNVLLHTEASVLIVREPVRERAPERVQRELVASLAGSP
jgi:nucleotide-binding universal stress UspA family protein